VAIAKLPIRKAVQARVEGIIPQVSNVGKGHQNAGCQPYRFRMGKDPKKPDRRQDLKRWDDEGGAPRSGHHFAEQSLPHPKTETALYYFNVRTDSGVIEDPEGDIYPDLQAVRDVAIARAHNMITEGDQQGEDRRSWRFEIMDRANQHVLTVGFSDDARRSGEARPG
jgi:hypothetical protein